MDRRKKFPFGRRMPKQKGFGSLKLGECESLLVLIRRHVVPRREYSPKPAVLRSYCRQSKMAARIGVPKDHLPMPLKAERDQSPRR